MKRKYRRIKEKKRKKGMSTATTGLEEEKGTKQRIKALEIKDKDGGMLYV